MRPAPRADPVGSSPGDFRPFSYANVIFVHLNPRAEAAWLWRMNATAYRELERVLERSLKAFSKTKQKLNRFERGRRDRVATILDEVARKRRHQERANADLISDAAQ